MRLNNVGVAVCFCAMVVIELIVNYCYLGYYKTNLVKSCSMPIFYILL